MALTFEEIIITVYREQFLLGQFSLSDNNDGNGVIISEWNVPNTPQPTHNEIMALDTPNTQILFDYYKFIDQGKTLLNNYVDSVAQQKQYYNGVSCASYENSTVPAWQAEASRFIEWRDSVYIYVASQQELMKNGTRTIPTFEDFKNELPLITWP